MFQIIVLSFGEDNSKKMYHCIFFGFVWERNNTVKALGLRPRAFICSSVFGTPDETWSTSFWYITSNIVCGVRGGVGLVWIGKHPRNAKVSQDFCPWLSGNKVGRKKAILSGFQACKSVFFGLWWKILIEQTFSQLSEFSELFWRIQLKWMIYTRNCGIS